MLTALVCASILLDETGPSCCSRPIYVHGSLEHYGNTVNSIPPGFSAEDFREEVYGKNFTAEVPNLPAGQYTILILGTEGYFDHAGARLMTVESEGSKLENVDLFERAGGRYKPALIELPVKHKGGSLTISFRALRDNAKFNTLIIRDEKGAPVASLRAHDMVDIELQNANIAPKVSGPDVYQDPSQSPEKRAQDLVRRMSLAEKVGQMVNQAKPIPRLGVKSYDWWNEALHGVARAGNATVFPQTIGLAATWDPKLVQEVFDTVSTEARAKYVAAGENGAEYSGLTFWTPNINIFRDPRWGRGQETYGEDPYMMSEFGSAVVRGLQGPDRNHPKSVATLKHFAVHSGPEPERHVFDVHPSDDDLYDTYLWHFERVVRDAKPWSIMGAYNSVFGEPACSSKFLLDEQLRKKWGFDGYVVSDCGAISDIWANHKKVATKAEASARAVIAGCDLECGGDYSSLVRAVNQHLIKEPEINRAVIRLFETRYRLGLMDAPTSGKWGGIKMSEFDTPANDDLAYRVAQRSQVLLTNKGILPLKRGSKVAVFGENATSVDMLVGNYNGIPSHPVTILKGIEKKAGVVYDKAFPDALREGQSYAIESSVLKMAMPVDTVIVVGGITAQLEGEEGAGQGFQGFKSGDRTSIELPAHQVAFVKAMHNLGKRVVFVNCSGSAMAMTKIEPYADAILQAWYPGQRGGDAVADVLFGDFNPCGKLPITFYKSDADLPNFRDYSMKNRTHRFFTGTPEFPFGYGLSYTTFEQKQTSVTRVGALLYAKTHVTNTGQREGVFSYSVFARPEKPIPGKPREMLVGFGHVSLAAGESQDVQVRVPLDRMALWNKKAKKRTVVPGRYRIQVGFVKDLALQLG